MTTDDILTGPGSASQVDWKALYLHLLVIFPYSVESVATQFGQKNAVRADIYDVDTGLPLLDALIFPAKLAGQTQGCEPGKAVVGRLTLGEAKGGQNAPWMLEDPTEADFTRARAYLAARPPRPVPTSTLRQPAATPAQQPTPPQQPQWTPQPQQPAAQQWQPQAPPQPAVQPQWTPQAVAGTPPTPPAAGPPAGLTGPAPTGSDDPPY
jgi:hypothetical protein